MVFLDEFEPVRDGEILSLIPETVYSCVLFLQHTVINTVQRFFIKMSIGFNYETA
jgi:hypothetical protein